MFQGDNKTCAKRVRIFIVALIMIPFALALSISHASCATWSLEDELAGGTEHELAEYRDSVRDTYGILVQIAYPLAAISFAAGAFRMITGGEREVEAGQKQMFYTLLALAAIILMPYAVEAGMNLGKTYGWSPP